MSEKEHDLNFAVRSSRGALYVARIVFTLDGLQIGYVSYLVGSEEGAANKRADFSTEFLATLSKVLGFCEKAIAAGCWGWVDLPTLGLVVKELDRMEAAGLIEGVKA